MLSQPKDRKIAALLAVVSAAVPLPISGLHKFYLKQPVWGILYMLLAWTPIPTVASAIEAVWYLAQDPDEFNAKFNDGLPITSDREAPAAAIDPAKIGAVADAVRQLDQLRADGLISEYEFEQKRRQLLDRIA